MDRIEKHGSLLSKPEKYIQDIEALQNCRKEQKNKGIIQFNIDSHAVISFYMMYKLLHFVYPVIISTHNYWLLIN